MIEYGLEQDRETFLWRYGYFSFYPPTPAFLSLLTSLDSSLGLAGTISMRIFTAASAIAGLFMKKTRHDLRISSTPPIRCRMAVLMSEERRGRRFYYVRALIYG